LKISSLKENDFMNVKTLRIKVSTKGHGDILDITSEVLNAVMQSKILNGVVVIFCPSSTSGLTTLEYESGCIHDLQRLFDEIIDPNRNYEHNSKWGDDNGHSHIRAAVLGPSLSIPIVDGRLTLGTWQQVIYIDFDNRARQRELVAQVLGS
jgi:secondary thiamine-phosphate synthase enzyme